jgi:hypothetical protein
MAVTSKPSSSGVFLNYMSICYRGKNLLNSIRIFQIKPLPHIAMKNAGMRFGVFVAA